MAGLPTSATYACTALLGVNKTGVLKPDADGYYEITLGALDVFNSAGAFYPLGPAKQLFEGSSSLMRRIENGNCKGECGHPKMSPGMSMRDYLARIMRIEETNVCCHFREVRLTTIPSKDGRGTVVGVVGKVKPSGPKGPALKEALDNPHENVCFSVRSLTNDTPHNGILHKSVKTIVCWDWVVEPGISVATKYNSPALESFEETSFTEAQLGSVADVSEGMGVGVESHTIVPVGDVMRDFGWDKAKSASTLPPSARW